MTPVNQPSGTNRPDKDRDSVPVYVPESEIPTVTVPILGSREAPATDDPTELPSPDDERVAGADSDQPPLVEDTPDEPTPSDEPTEAEADSTEQAPAAVDIEDTPAEQPSDPLEETVPDDVSGQNQPTEPEDESAEQPSMVEDASEAVPGEEPADVEAAPTEQASAPANDTAPDAPDQDEPTDTEHPAAPPEAVPDVTDAEDAPAEQLPDPVEDAETTPDVPDDQPVAHGELSVPAGWGGRELVESVYGPLTEFYERLDATLREEPADVPPVGWAPHVAALRAFRDERVTGDWDVLARLLVAPTALDDGTETATDAVRLVQTEQATETVHEIVRELAAADERALLITPTPEQAADVLLALEDDPEVFSLVIDARPIVAEPASVKTQALPPLDDDEPLPRRGSGSSGTVEFKPVAHPPEPEQAPEEESAPDEEDAPETRIASATLRPIGQAWRRSWTTEVRLLRRGLMWLEQWPRDAATLRSVQTENAQRKEALEAERAALDTAIEECRNARETAVRTAEEAEAEAERLTTVQQEAEAELAGPRAEAERLQAIADESASTATVRTRTADAAYARRVQLDQRAKTAQAELQAARQAEAELTDELARAREALPGAAEEADRLTAADAETAGEGHAAYYRLVSAESRLAAVRRKRTLGQRLHVASPPAELNELRAEVKARSREADEAAKRANQAKEAAEQADRVRRGLASFVSEGGARLKAAQEAQGRLGTELTWLATEREAAAAEHTEQARLASVAVEKATGDGLEARAAQQAAQVIQDRVNAART